MTRLKYSAYFLSIIIIIIGIITTPFTSIEQIVAIVSLISINQVLGIVLFFLSTKGNESDSFKAFSISFEVYFYQIIKKILFSFFGYIPLLLILFLSFYSNDGFYIFYITVCQYLINIFFLFYLRIGIKNNDKYRPLFLGIPTFLIIVLLIASTNEKIEYLLFCPLLSLSFIFKFYNLSTLLQLSLPLILVLLTYIVLKMKISKRGWGS